ncbi:MAG: Sir2 family NAD-dependent protein deacetylase [Candidatus Latescibacteria bacterium]|nr:Sir2 family NAD-dependent protein deacetylase [Candidatus Latescibacterota bacterium]
MSPTADSRLIDLIRDAHRTLVFTGAGVSTASGIPDFRGPQGVWKTRQPIYFQDFLASEEARAEYWREKLEAWAVFRDARPNAVHEATARLEQAGKIEGIVTQNIDGLHAKAGTSVDRLVELHGTNAQVECLSCGERSDPEDHFASFRASERCPTCDCGGYLKSATISFGQNLREEDLQCAADMAASADLAIALGSTLSVYPAANVPLLAAQRGAPYVVINRGVTEQDANPSVTLRLEGDVTEIFPSAVDEALA